MQISKNSWLYKIAYGLSDNKPEVTNLCNFFWRTVFQLFIEWPVMLVVGTVLFICMYVFGLLIDGSYPDCTGNPKKGINWVPYKYWPIVGGRRFSPLSLMGVFVAGFGGWLLTCWIANNAADIFLAIAPYLTATFYLIGGAALMFSAIWSVLWLFDSEFYRLTKEYVLAKKQKICPIIHFTE